MSASSVVVGIDVAKAQYAAARRVDRMRDIAKAGINVLALDVTDDVSMRAGIDSIISMSGRIDVLVNNAGYGSYGAVEDVPLEEARAQFEVNVFGAVRLIQLALPHMRRNRTGTIVNITSMGGKIHTPLGAWYHGTKFALEAISDCLRMEVQPFGIDVVVVEPGGIKTEWAGIAADKLLEVSGKVPMPLRLARWLILWSVKPAASVSRRPNSSLTPSARPSQPVGRRPDTPSASAPSR